MSLLYDTWYLFVRALTKLIRTPILLFFSLLQPIIFLLLFTQLFSKIAAAFPSFGGVSYLAFATPGILLQNAFSSSLQSGTSIVDDLNLGYVQKFLVTPVNRSAILLGRLCCDAFRVVAQSLIILVLAYLLGFSFTTEVPGILAAFFLIAYFGFAWSGISLTIGLTTRSAETVFGLGGILTFPLLFMSTALVPAKGFMPNWMVTVSSYNPISYTVNAVRDLALKGFVFGDIASALLVITGIALVTQAATLYKFRKIVS